MLSWDEKWNEKKWIENLRKTTILVRKKQKKTCTDNKSIKKTLHLTPYFTSPPPDVALPSFFIAKKPHLLSSDPLRPPFCPLLLLTDPHNIQFNIKKHSSNPSFYCKFWIDSRFRVSPVKFRLKIGSMSDKKHRGPTGLFCRKTNSVCVGKKIEEWKVFLSNWIVCLSELRRKQKKLSTYRNKSQVSIAMKKKIILLLNYSTNFLVYLQG